VAEARELLDQWQLGVGLRRPESSYYTYYAIKYRRKHGLLY